jgi:2-iminobutanoate/2-iminopropanoate deaminase
VNAVYAQYFNEKPPARMAYGVAALPFGAEVEIDAVALIP